MEPKYWRPATAGDLQEINRIADQIHITLPERDEVFEEKIRLSPETCFVLVRHNELVGYGISHPWYLYNVPALDTFLGALPSLPECLFIHDVAILPEARGGGAAGTLVELVNDIARSREIPYLALVSVYNTEPVWARYGFRTVSDPTLAEKLRQYGDIAKYMIRKLE
jgi:hypothetical protein